MVDYDPFSEEVMTHPHPIYRRLRDEAPAYFIEKYNAWALSRFQDIWDASMDAESYSTEQGTTPAQLLTRVQPVTPMINLMDPPRHTELRAQIRSFFLPGAVAKLEPRVRELAGTRLRDFCERGECDVVGDFTAHVSVNVACWISGFPVEDIPMLNALVQRFFAREEGVTGMTADGVAALMEMNGYFAELSRTRRKRPVDEANILNAFLNGEVGGSKISDEDLGSHLSMLLIGGSETFPKVFANSTWRLWEHPEQRAELARDVDLIPDAFMELLRYDMPTQFLGRTLLRDVQIQGQTLRKGQVVLFLYPSGNRDEREFPNPDVLDIKRKPMRILSFGHGTHTCLGMHVAKLEGKICLELLLQHMPEYEVQLEKAERIRTEFVQGFLSLPIGFKPFSL